MSEFLDHLQQRTVENYIPHMYQDGPGNVTIGIGTNLTANGAADAAVRLLLGKAVLKTSKKREPATAEQIRQEYNAVFALDLRNSAGGRSLASEYEPHTAMVIGRSVVRQFAEDHIRPELTRVGNSGDYPDLDKRSKSAQIALADIVYSMGASGFLEKFKKFKIAFNRRDWIAAADESSRRGNPARNGIIRDMLIAHAASEPFFIDAKGKTIGIDRLD
jgi:GH24 family phage-related lysozyme (muramidase)